MLIVGAGIAGPALAHGLASLRSPTQPPLRIALLERSLAEPNRIVGELLQPGGVKALNTLGIRDCLHGIDAIPVHGYAVLYKGRTVQIPYPKLEEGRSFHHGRFVMNLREKARRARGVELIEATVSDLIECPFTSQVIGVRATRKATDGVLSTPMPESLFADLTIIADGCFSKFRSQVLGPSLRAPTLKSHFIGFVLEGVKLPIAQHGTVALVPGTGPVLLYQIGENDTRMLVDVQGGLPKDIPVRHFCPIRLISNLICFCQTYVKEKIMPSLPKNLHNAIMDAIDKERPKSMPNSFLPASLQGTHHAKEGVFLIGDSWNMRHPLTGGKQAPISIQRCSNSALVITGGMTVALSDVVILRDLLKPLITASADAPTPASADRLEHIAPSPRPLADWSQVAPLLSKFHWSRKPLASTVNILSVALYDLFGAEGQCYHIPTRMALAISLLFLEVGILQSGGFYMSICQSVFAYPVPLPLALLDENLFVLREGCFKYFELGGECVNGPVSLLSGYVTRFNAIDHYSCCFSLYRLAPKPFLLAYHFFSVAMYSIQMLFTSPRVRPGVRTIKSGKVQGAVAGIRECVQDEMVIPTFAEYPELVAKSFAAVSPSLLSTNGTILT